MLIDGFGARQQGGQYLMGHGATIDTDDNRVVHLDGPVDLTRINKYFDTIYLANDTVVDRGLPRGAYRIVDSDDIAQTVTLDGEPLLSDASAWNIPAGLSADEMPELVSLGFPAFTDHFDPPADVAHPERAIRGHDHYDAVLFLIHRGAPMEWYRWSTYTSRDYGSWRPEPQNGVDQWGDLMSSIRGNQPYFFYSYRSGGQFKNYTFLITDPRSSEAGLSWKDAAASFTNPSNHESSARFYYGKPDQLPNPLTDVLSEHVEDDANGKTVVEFHRGNFAGHYCGSGGCLVSPNHINLRNRIIGFYLDDYSAFYGVQRGSTDPYLNGPPGGVGLAQADTYAESETHWLADSPASVGQGGYNKKLTGVLWLIRPDEPPLGMRMSSLGPTVTGLSPITGPAAGGTAVQLTGSNLAGLSRVMFGAEPATKLAELNPGTKWTVVAPAGTGTVDVIVTATAGISVPETSRRFTYK